MLPGPTIIKECSACLQLIEEHTIMSGNTCGAVYWTDGKRNAPMLPDRPLLVACPHCQALIWIDELHYVGERDAFDRDSGFTGALAYNAVRFEGYFRLLAQEGHTLEQERYLRLQAWWAGNNSRRRRGVAPQALSEPERDNLLALAAMLDEENVEDRIMLAEILRELGRFDEAVTMLEGDFDGKVATAVAVIRTLALEKNPFVSRY